MTDLAPPRIDPSKKYFLRNHYLARYLALNQNDLVVASGKVHDGRHEWKFIPVRGGFFIQNVATQKFLGFDWFGNNSPNGLEYVPATNEARTFSLAAQGAYWTISPRVPEARSKLFLNSHDQTYFNYCNAHGSENYPSSSRASRKQWTCESVDEANGFPKGLAPNVRYKLQNETRPHCYLWADGRTRDEVNFHLDDGNVNNVIVFTLSVDGRGGVCLQFNLGFDSRSQYLALSSDRKSLFASDDKFYWQIHPKPHSNAYYIANGNQAVSSVPPGKHVLTPRANIPEQAWFFKV